MERMRRKVKNRLPLYTLNPKDLRGLESLVEIVDIGS
jgi:hypothetical protein